MFFFLYSRRNRSKRRSCRLEARKTRVYICRVDDKDVLFNSSVIEIAPD